MVFVMVHLCLGKFSMIRDRSLIMTWGVIILWGVFLKGKIEN